MEGTRPSTHPPLSDPSRLLEGLEEAARSSLIQGKDLKAIEFLCAGLELRHRLDEAQVGIGEFARKLIAKGVELAGKKLEKKDEHGALSLLTPIHSVISPFPPSSLLPELFSLHTSLSSIYRHLGDFAASKEHISTALLLASTHPSHPLPLSTAYLSQCVLQSTLNQHQSALDSALQAYKSSESELARVGDRKETRTVLAVACHNVGVELEHLGRTEEAVDWFKRAAKALEKNQDWQVEGRSVQSVLISWERRKGSIGSVHRRKSVKGKKVCHKLAGGTEGLLRPETARDRVLTSHRSGSVKRVRRREDDQTWDSLGDSEINYPSSGVYQRFTGDIHLNIPPKNARFTASPHLPDLNSTDQDLKVLESMGLLEYTITPSPPPPRPVPIRVRGRKRGCGIPRNHSEATNSSDTSGKGGVQAKGEQWEDGGSSHEGQSAVSLRIDPKSESESLIIRPEEAKIEPKERGLVRGATPLPAAPSPALVSNTKKAIEKAVVVLQANFRRVLAKKRAEIERKSRLRRTIMHRTGRKLSDGGLYIVTVYRGNGGLIAVVDSGETVKELTFSLNCGLSASEIALIVDIGATGGLEVPPSPAKRTLIPPPSASPSKSVPIFTSLLSKSVLPPVIEEHPDSAVPSQSEPDPKPSEMAIIPPPPHTPALFPAKTTVIPEDTKPTTAANSPLIVIIPPIHHNLPPTLIVHKTDIENVRNTDGFRRIPSLETPPSPSPLKLQSAAIRLQSRFRALLARRRFALLRSLKSVKYPIYRSFAVRNRYCYAYSLYQIDKTYQVEIETLESGSKVTAEVPKSKSESLEMAKLWVLSLLGSCVERKETEEVTDNIDMNKREKAAIRIQKCIRGMLTRIRYAKKQTESRRKLRFCRRKVINSEELFIAIYSLRDQIVQIESYKVNKKLQLKYRNQIITFTAEKLREMYRRDPTFEVMFEDCVLDEGVVRLRPRIRYAEMPPDRNLLPAASNPILPTESRTILRVSKKLDHRMWVITAFLLNPQPNQTTPLPTNLLEFSAFCGGVGSALKVTAALGDLAAKTKQPLDAVYPIGYLVISHMLTVSERGLILDLEAELPNIDHLVTLAQAQVRGFLTRRRFPISRPPHGLISCVIKSLQGTDFILYAYSDPRGVLFHAVERTGAQVYTCRLEGDIVTELPSSINRKRLIEDLMFPRIELETTTEGTLLILTEIDYDQFVNRLDSYIIKPKSQGLRTGTIQSVRRVHTVLRAVLDLKPRPVTRWSHRGGSVNGTAKGGGKDREKGRKVGSVICLAAGLSNIAGQKTRLNAGGTEGGREEGTREEGRQGAGREGAGRQEIGEKEARNLEPASENGAMAVIGAHKGEMVARSGLEVSGEMYTASVYDTSKSIRIELIHTKNKVSISKETHLPHFPTKTQRDLYCSDLLSRVSLYPGSQGLSILDLAPSPDSPRVIYRRSHYLSGRYVLITACEEDVEVVIWVNEGERGGNLRLSIPKDKETDRETAFLTVLRLIPRLSINHDKLILTQ